MRTVHASTAARRRLASDAGTALAETALVTPIFIVILFAIVEFGLVYRDSLTIADAVGDAVRWEAVQGPDIRQIEFPEDSGNNVPVSADYSAVRAVREATSGISPKEIDRIVVYRVTRDQLRQGVSPVSLVPDSCKTGSASSTGDKCNVYPAFESFLAVQDGQTDYFECNDGTERACGWPPTSREDGPSPAIIDYVGVYVKMKHDYVTGIFGSSFDLEQAKVLRLEPGQVE